LIEPKLSYLPRELHSDLSYVLSEVLDEDLN